jgi:hypothetical protein
VRDITKRKEQTMPRPLDKYVIGKLFFESRKTKIAEAYVHPQYTAKIKQTRGRRVSTLNLNNYVGRLSLETRKTIISQDSICDVIRQVVPKTEPEYHPASQRQASHAHNYLQCDEETSRIESGGRQSKRTNNFPS